MTRTKGNIIVENIQVGDIHYEFEYGHGIKCQVLSKPMQNIDGAWEWKAENLKTGEIIDYLVTPGFEHYGPNLYDHEAYIGVKWD